MKVRRPIQKQQQEYRFDVDARVRFRAVDARDEEDAVNMFQDALRDALENLYLEIDVSSYRPEGT